MCLTAADRPGGQQDTAAVSVTLPVLQKRRREEVQFKGKDFHRVGLRFYFYLSALRKFPSLFVRSCLNKFDSCSRVLLYSISTKYKIDSFLLFCFSKKHPTLKKRTAFFYLLGVFIKYIFCGIGDKKLIS